VQALRALSIVVLLSAPAGTHLPQRRLAWSIGSATAPVLCGGQWVFQEVRRGRQAGYLQRQLNHGGALRGGELDASTLTYDQVLIADAKGWGLKVVMPLDYSVGGDAILASAAVHDIQDLKDARLPSRPCLRRTSYWAMRSLNGPVAERTCNRSMSHRKRLSQPWLRAPWMRV